MNSLKNCSGAARVRAGSGIVISKKSLLLVIPVFILMACGPSREEKVMQEAVAAYNEKEKVLADSISSYAPGIVTETVGGITHNFIRTANMKFKVKDVLNSTRKIEQITALAGG
ncbi:MAG: hypothetical protein K0S12_142, partial [Bacteroidetes bacterium]|nr:hypothetical protein [Bacteroidota bacterium]